MEGASISGPYTTYHITAKDILPHRPSYHTTVQHHTSSQDPPAPLTPTCRVLFSAGDVSANALSSHLDCAAHLKSKWKDNRRRTKKLAGTCQGYIPPNRRSNKKPSTCTDRCHAYISRKHEHTLSYPPTSNPGYLNRRYDSFNAMSERANIHTAKIENFDPCVSLLRI